MIDVNNLSFGGACLLSLICMLIVFGVLFLLWGLVALMNTLTSKSKKSIKVLDNSNTTYQNIEDITDPDMMVAALVASIDYHDEVKKDVRVKSIKEL